jgi:hypothetical protein
MGRGIRDVTSKLGYGRAGRAEKRAGVLGVLGVLYGRAQHAHWACWGRAGVLGVLGVLYGRANISSTPVGRAGRARGHAGQACWAF